jgi:hypothetical protein
VKSGCLVLGHRWEDSHDDADAEYGKHPILHCARCGKQKAFSAGKALDPVFRLDRLGRLRLLLTQAAPWVGLGVLIGLVIPGIVAISAYAAGDRGTHEVMTVVIALAVEGGLCLLFAMLTDPTRLWDQPYDSASPTYMSTVTSAFSRRDNSRLNTGRLARIDDVLSATGVVLIVIAVLLHAYA